MGIFFLVLSRMSEICKKKIPITTTSLKKMPILAFLGLFWPVFVKVKYGCYILGDSVSTSAPARVRRRPHWSDNQMLKIAKKGVFTQKIAKKWIFGKRA